MAIKVSQELSIFLHIGFVGKGIVNAKDPVDPTLTFSVRCPKV